MADIKLRPEVAEAKARVDARLNGEQRVEGDKKIGSQSAENNNLNSPLEQAPKLLRYPRSLGDGDDGQNNFILFNINVQKNTAGYKTPATATSQVSGLSAGSGKPKASVSGENTQLVAQGARQNVNTNLKGNAFLSRATTRIDTSIAIYMPGSFSVSQAPSWDAVELSAGLASEQVGQLGNLGSLQDFRNNTSASLKNAGNIGSKFFATAGSGALGAVDSVFQTNFKAARDVATGSVVNPFVEVAFKAMANRTFAFEFLFTPITEEEAAEVRKIIKQFRYHSAPEFSREGVKAYLIYPSEFDISFYRIPEDGNQAIENDKIPKINTCVCTQVDVVYSDVENWVTFEDGMPVQTKLSLQFTEMAMLTKQLIGGANGKLLDSDGGY